MTGLNCAKVSVSNLNFSIDKEFSYQIPSNLKNEIEIGTRVIVPFGRTNKKREGVVTDIFEYDGIMPLKPIYQTVDNERLITKESIDLARFISKKYYSSLYDAILLLMPPGSNIKFKEYVSLISNNTDINMSDLKRFIIDYLSDKDQPISIKELETKTGNDSVRKAVIELKKSGIVEVTEENQNAHNQKALQIASLLLEEFETIDYMEQFLKKAFAQRRVLEMLLENGKMPIVDLIAFSGASRGSITSLQKKGIIDIVEEVLEVDPFVSEKIQSSEKPTLNTEQILVVERILEKREEKKFNEFLIKGVTGSGKTEVYLELVEHIIKEEKQAIILVPEIALTPQIRGRFFNRFGENVAVLHSALSISERKVQWRKIECGEVSVVVGARSAVFAPFSKLAMIIVDEEHETTYKSENTPRYNAKEVARYRLEQVNGTLVLSSATPSVENYYRAKTGEIELLTLENRYNNVMLPEVEIVDMREELKNGNISVMSERLKEKLLEVKVTEQKAIILLNRRGYSTFVSCRDCGFVIKCNKCDVALTYHSISGELQCHYCGFSQPLTRVCPDCHSTSLRYFGSGTQKLEEELYKMFSDTQIIRMDNDTTTTKMSHERLLNQFSKQKCAILLGTQMIAKGLDFKDVAVVGVISADSSLFLGGFNGAEKTFSLITQVCGRAGRGINRGYAIVQTYNPEHYAILASQDQDYDKFYNNEIAFRKNMKYPPFCEIINVIFTGDDADKIFAMADGIKKIMTEKVDMYNERENYIAMYGPVPCGIAKIRDKYRFHILIKCRTSSSIHNSFSEAVKELILKNKYDIQVAVDVNPVNFI